MTILSVDSLAFRAWFGNSKVVDAAGNPLPVYHGTRRPIVLAQGLENLGLPLDRWPILRMIQK